MEKAVKKSSARLLARAALEQPLGAPYAAAQVDAERDCANVMRNTSCGAVGSMCGAGGVATRGKSKGAARG